MIGGFGETGQTHSQGLAWEACVICRVPIRISAFLLGTFFVQVVSVLQGGFNLFVLLVVCGSQAVLLATILCHEFGHGNMARALGGDIDHILLWPFGGICFSSRPRGVSDPATLLRNELWVVLAGPSTHLLMGPLWALLLYGFDCLMQQHEQCSSATPCTTCSGMACVWGFANPIGTTPTVYTDNSGRILMGEAPAVLWRLLGTGLQLNVSLFLFNVFFPMYPADGSKILTVGLMHCCGASPRLAAGVLIWASTSSAALLIVYAAWSLRPGGALLHDGGAGAMMAGLMGWMGVMSLVEAWRLYDLRAQRRLHQHALFATARLPGVVTRRDEHGLFHQVSDTDVDDADAGTCCLCSCSCCCCCGGLCGPATISSDGEEEADGSASAQETTVTSQAGADHEAQREHRERFLHSLEERAARQNRTARR